jgi:hypothetical protein
MPVHVRGDRTSKLPMQTRPIVTQNAHGPCGLLAVINPLLLNGVLHISSDIKSISLDEIFMLLKDLLSTQETFNENDITGKACVLYIMSKNILHTMYLRIF